MCHSDENYKIGYFKPQVNNTILADYTENDFLH